MKYLLSLLIICSSACGMSIREKISLLEALNGDRHFKVHKTMYEFPDCRDKSRTYLVYSDIANLYLKEVLDIDTIETDSQENFRQFVLENRDSIEQETLPISQWQRLERLRVYSVLAFEKPEYKQFLKALCDKDFNQADRLFRLLHNRRKISAECPFI